MLRPSLSPAARGSAAGGDGSRGGGACSGDEGPLTSGGGGGGGGREGGGGAGLSGDGCLGALPKPRGAPFAAVEYAIQSPHALVFLAAPGLLVLALSSFVLLLNLVSRTPENPQDSHGAVQGINKLSGDAQGGGAAGPDSLAGVAEVTVKAEPPPS